MAVSFLMQATIASAVATTAAMTPIVSQSVVPDGANGPAIAAGNMIAGILGYSRWPASDGPVRLCLTGGSPLTAALPDRQLISGRMLSVSRRTIASVVADSGCDAVFIGTVAASDRRRLVEHAMGRAIVTMTDDDPYCRSGVMFCIRLDARGLNLDLNVDAVSRSQVRVDPRVLNLASRTGFAP